MQGPASDGLVIEQLRLAVKLLYGAHAQVAFDSAEDTELQQRVLVTVKGLCPDADQGITTRRAAEYEIDRGDGARTILRGHPCYCPQEHRHEPHEFLYVYFRGESPESLTKGSYFCFGDPAPWAEGEG